MVLVRRFAWLVVLVLGGKEFDETEKTPAHFVGSMIHSRPRVWKRLRHVGLSGISMPDHTRRRCDHAYGVTKSCSDQDWGGVIPWKLCRHTSPGLHDRLISFLL